MVASPDRSAAGTIVVLPDGVTRIGRAPASAELAHAIDDPVWGNRELTLLVDGDADQLRWSSDASQMAVEDAAPIWQGGHALRRGVAGNGTVLRFGSTIAVVERDSGEFFDFDASTAEVVGRSATARTIRGRIADAARAGAPVLLYGPTGTGKEHAATLLHRLSGREGALVRVNVTAIPKDLFESTLFGHGRGAFTGAERAKVGLVREAARGTLVLDEIGELPLAVQPKLLRLLDGAAMRPVGGDRDEVVDLQICASTNANLERMVANGGFRQDLLARLRMFAVGLPRLDRRRPDILELADAVLPNAAGTPWREALSPEMVEWLLLQSFDDNIRELKALLLHIEARSRYGLVTPGSLGHELDWGAVAGVRAPTPIDVVHRSNVTSRAPAGATSRSPAAVRPAKPTAQRPDGDALRGMLRRFRGNLQQIGAEMGCDRRQVYRWLTYSGITADDLAGYRDAEDSSGGTGPRDRDDRGRARWNRFENPVVTAHAETDPDRAD